MLTRTGRYPLWLMVMGLAVLLILAGCSSPEPVVVPEPEVPQDVEEPAAETPEPPEAVNLEDLPVFTLEELAEYDGLDGRPAYVAVDGLVYDFSELERWAGGEHFDYQAGQDLTVALHEESPHGDIVLDRAPVVGRLAE